MNGLLAVPGFTPELLASITSFSLTGPAAFLREIQDLSHAGSCRR
jgi:hypothetical protein